MSSRKSIGDGGKTSKSLSRLIERFRAVESRGSSLIEGICAGLERCEMMKKYQDGRAQLPGRFGNDVRDIDETEQQTRLPDMTRLVDLLLFRLITKMEQTFEQLRLVLEELDMITKQMSKTTPNDLNKHPNDDQYIFLYGQEFWRKRLLLESTYITDPLETFQALRLVWPFPNSQILQ